MSESSTVRRRAWNSLWASIVEKLRGGGNGSRGATLPLPFARRTPRARRAAEPTRGKRPRDSQRAKLYRAEQSRPQGRRFATLPQCQHYVDSVLRSPWWRGVHPDIETVRVKDGRGRRSAAAWHQAREIALPRHARSELTILHELAHLVTPPTFAGHGPEFAATYLDLVGRFMPPPAAEDLRTAFREHRVRVAE